MTATNSVAVQVACTLTLTASGGDPNTPTLTDSAEFNPAISNAPFSDLAISVVPINTGNYMVEVFHDGELEETHTFPTATNKYVCHMSFPNVIFPANLGTNTIPKYFGDSRKDFPGVPITLKITNLSSERETFNVYATFLEYDHCRFARITTISYK